MREPKINASLCFFNNGSTLYCFGGVKKCGMHQMEALTSIERLSKGQNSWLKLSVGLPIPIFDLGAHQIPDSTDIVLFGGYTNSNSSDQVWIYETQDEGNF